MKIGMIAGNFDVIHMGYIYMFDECAKNCNHLICFLHDDPSEERPHKLKPIHTLAERERMLKSFVQINEIITYRTEAELYELIKNKEINIRFLGDDYKGKKFTGIDLNIPIHYLDRSHGWSTTKFKKMIANSIE
jgi:glycerol-3-phosphate cytidylyltransferase